MKGEDDLRFMQKAMASIMREKNLICTVLQIELLTVQAANVCTLDFT